MLGPGELCLTVFVYFSSPFILPSYFLLFKLSNFDNLTILLSLYVNAPIRVHSYYLFTLK